MGEKEEGEEKMNFKQIIIGFVAFIMLGASVAGGMAFSGNGSGTAGDPYQITTLSELNETRLDCTKYYRLMNDINADETYNWSNGFIPMCPWGSTLSGVFYGDNHTIRNLYINRPGVEAVALFAYLDGGGEVYDLNLRDVNISGQNMVAGIVGRHRLGNPIIDGCSVTGVIYASSGEAGGIAGFSHLGSIINNSYTMVTLTGGHYLGGITGNSDGNIYNSFSNSVINTTGGDNIGGLVGTCDGGMRLENSYSLGYVKGDQYVGGIIGRGISGGCHINNSYSQATIAGNRYVGGGVGAFFSSTHNIYNSYSTGLVTGSADVGGFIGYMSAGNVSNSYWDNETSGQSTSVAGTGLKTTDMFKEASFTGFDFVDMWTILEDTDYPDIKNNPRTLCTNNSECGICEKCEGGYCVVQTSSEDLENECSQGLIDCLNDYTLRGGDGFCSGQGACDVVNYLVNVSTGNVCIAGSDSNPTNNTKCNLWYECILHNEWASGYYVGYAGDGTSSCVSADWQDANITWNATSGWWINQTENNTVCQEELYYTVPGAGAYVSSGSGEWPEDPEVIIPEQEPDLLIDIEVEKSEFDFLTDTWEDHVFVSLEAKEEPVAFGVVPSPKQVVGIAKIIQGIVNGFNSFIDFFKSIGFTS